MTTTRFIDGRSCDTGEPVVLATTDVIPPYAVPIGMVWKSTDCTGSTACAYVAGNTVTADTIREAEAAAQRAARQLLRGVITPEEAADDMAGAAYVIRCAKADALAQATLIVL